MVDPQEKSLADKATKQSFLDSNYGEKKGFFRNLEGFLQQQVDNFSKEQIAEEVLVIHDKKMVDMRFFAKMAAVIDNDKFCAKEFLIYIKICYCLKYGIQGYEELYKPTKLLQVAIQAKDSFLKIDQAELTYRSSKQQEVYEFVEERLMCIEEMTDSTSIFKSQLKNKVEEIIPQIKTDEGKTALKAYVKELDRIADNELGLKLLSLFKAYHLDDYSILKKISDLAVSLKKYDLMDFKKLQTSVAMQFETFQKLGKIIGIPPNKNNLTTYTTILQYIALEYRHGMVRIKFDELLQVLRKWYQPYQMIVNLRNQFSASEYQIPKEFTAPIPGLEIYEKYQISLTDKKTGFTYLNFDE